jgi:ATP-binding cassette subfamily B protein
MADPQEVNEQKSGSGIRFPLLGRVMSYTRPYRRFFILAIFLTILLSLLGPIRPMIFQYILDNEVLSGDFRGLRLLILLVTGLLMVEALVMYANTYLTNWLGQSVIRDIRNQVFAHILDLKLKFFDNTPIGRLQTRTVSDVETLNDVFTSGLVRIMGDILQLVAIISLMLYTNWQLTLVVLTTLPLIILATYVFKVKVQIAFRRVRQAVSEMNSFLQEHITGMPIVHIFNREAEEHEKFDGINRRLRKANLNSVLYYSVFFPVVEIITALAMALLVWFGASRILDGSLRFGELVAFIMYLQMFFRPIRMLAEQFNTLQLGLVSAERIFKLLDTNEFIPNNGKTPAPTLHAPLSIEFRNVNFAYNEPEWVLKDVNLKVGAGERVALVGATGSGKSTIINLLSRFYEIQKGDILLEDKNIQAYDLYELRRLIGVVLQDVFLFSGSIRDNITLNNPEIPQEVVETAAKRVGAHDFISRLPGGYDYNVRERGASLSLGQRQLISFARVMVYDPRILVLDEATANIDSESEAIIQHAVDTVLAGRTSIIIAHRLSTIQQADQIVLLEKGRILESGNHQELLAKRGAYFELYELQFAS